MKNKRFFQYAMVLFVMSCLTLKAQDLIDKGNRWEWKSDKEFVVKSGGKLQMSDIHGDVSICSWDQNKVGIHAVHAIQVLTKTEAEAVIQKYDVTYKQESNTVIVEGIEIGHQPVGSDYKIHIPKQFHCDISMSAGDLEVEKIEGNIDAHVGGGDVKISGILGPVTLDVGGGDIQIEFCQKDMDIHLGGGDLEIENAGGPIQIQMGGGDATIEKCAGPVVLELGGGDLEIDQLEKDVQLQVGGGDVEITNIQGNAQCELGGGSIEIKDVAGSLSVKTGGGDIEALLTNAATFKNPMHLETSIGEIDLTLPASIKADILIEIQKIHDFSEEQVYSDFPLKISGNGDGMDGKIRATGTIHGGGPVIDLKTRGGDISINEEEI